MTEVTTQIADRDTFINRMKASGSTLFVTRWASVEPVKDGDKIVMWPSIHVQYLFKDKEDEIAIYNWIFVEVRLSDKDGVVSLHDTLWAELQNQESVEWRLVHKSGTF